MKKIGFVITFLVLMIPLSIKASCTTEELSKYSKLASNINTSYNYTENNENVNFSITFTNLTSGLYLYDVSNQREYRYNGDSEATYAGYIDGKSHKFLVYTNDSTCSYSAIRTIYVTLPYYNAYYSDEECEGYENIKYCQKWYKLNMSHGEFLLALDEEKSKFNKTNNDNKKVTNSYQISSILDFYVKYYYLILPLFIILIILLEIIRKNKKKKQNIF